MVCIRLCASRRIKVCTLASGLSISLLMSLAWAKDSSSNACSRSAKDALKSCRFQAQADYWLALGMCENLSGRSERAACKREALAAYREAVSTCRDQFEARDDVCDELGGGPYDPAIRPEDFVRGVTNPFYPLVPGTTYIYESETEVGLEHIEVKVTHDTRTILGVVCIVVRDSSTVNGELSEDTLDFFAQDKEGNVWYFGEHSEGFEEGVLTSLGGSWEAGVDGAKPGIIMEAKPRKGDVYRQEFLLGEAEDMGEILALGQKVTVPFGSIEGCLQTRDFSPLEPDAIENKFYAPGLGVVLEVDLESGARTELIKVLEE